LKLKASHFRSVLPVKLSAKVRKHGHSVESPYVAVQKAGESLDSSLHFGSSIPGGIRCEQLWDTLIASDGGIWPQRVGRAVSSGSIIHLLDLEHSLYIFEAYVYQHSSA
jgi:hypothetical protein